MLADCPRLGAECLERVVKGLRGGEHKSKNEESRRVADGRRRAGI
jgi:hypothetical protein